MDFKDKKQEEIDTFQSIAEGKLEIRLISMECEFNKIAIKEKKSNEEILLLLNVIKQKNLINRCIKEIEEDYKKVLLLNSNNDNNS